MRASHYANIKTILLELKITATVPEPVSFTYEKNTGRGYVSLWTKYDAHMESGNLQCHR